MYDEDCVNKLNVSYVKKMFESQDVICLNETWTNSDNEKDIAFNDFVPFCNSRKQRNKKANRDSGGVAILVRKNILKFISQQPNVSDDSVWIKIDKKLLDTKKDLYLCTVYIPPEKSSYTTNFNLDSWDLIEKEIQFS